MRSLKSLLLRYRSNIIAAFSIMLIGIALLSIYYSVEVRVTSNDECLWEPKKINKDSTAIFFNLVKVDGVTWNAGIRDGDQLLEIDGIPIHLDLQAQAILNTFDEGEYARVQIFKGGQSIYNESFC